MVRPSVRFGFTALIFGLILFQFSKTQAGVLMQGFWWDSPSSWDRPWWNAVGDKAGELAASGFTAVWLPPAYKSAAGGFSVGYDPFDDYDLGNKDQRGTIPTRWGTKTQLVKAVSRLRAHGLDVYLDFVLGHRNGDDGNKNFYYRNALGNTHGGRFQKGPMDFLWENAMFGRALNYSNPYVRTGLMEAGQWQVETLGTQGIRVDHAKGIPADFLRDFFHFGSLARQFVVLEYWEENLDALSSYLSQGLYGRVSSFDFALWGKLKEMGNGRGFFNMRHLQQAGMAGRDPGASVTFVENHDTVRSWPTLTGKHLGYAYILTSEGYPSVFWLDYYVHGMKPTIDNLVWIHERLASGGTLYRWADDDLLIYERQGGAKLLVGLNDNTTSARREWVSTHFGGNVELEDYTGRHPRVRTAADGRVQIEVKPDSFAAYAPAGLSGSIERRPAQPVLQVFRGADDLDIAAANASSFTPTETVSLAANSKVHWWLEFEGGEPAQSIEIQAVDTRGKTNLIYKGQGRSVNGQFYSTNAADVRLEIRAHGAKPRLPYKLTVQYLGQQ